MTTPLIEAIAGRIRSMSLHEREAYAVTQAALTAITEAGYVIVPREPTEAMCDAGNNALCDNGVDSVADDDAPFCYRAMINAAQGDGA